MNPVDRRAFLKSVAAATAASAVPVVPAAATPAIPVAKTAPRAAAPTWQKAPCTLCDIGCGLLVGIERGRAVGVKADPRATVGQGVACAKGYYSVQALYARDRLTRASIRTDQSNRVVPIGEALDLVATTLRETIARHGKDSVALFGSSGLGIVDAYVAGKFAKGALGTNNVDCDARANAAVRAGLQATFGLDGSVGSYADIEQADTIILWDANIAETHPVLFSRMLARRASRPSVRIIDVATRTTRTSYACDRSLLHAPGTTVAVAQAVCSDLVAQDAIDREFLGRHVAFKRASGALGYGVTSDAVVVEDARDVDMDEYVRSLAAFTPDAVQARAGLATAEIRWLASLYADRTRKVLSVWGANVSEHARGTHANTVLYNIHLLVGRIAQPGNGALALASSVGGGDSVALAGCATDLLPRGRVTDEADRRRAAEIWGVPADRIDARPTYMGLGLFRALERGDIRFLWIQGANPLATLPNLDRYRRAANKAGAFVVVSSPFPTSTTQAADVVLPSAMWLEGEGVYANGERRLQHAELMLAAPGDAMTIAWQTIEVARRLGMGSLFPTNRRGHVEQLWTEYRRFHDGAAQSIPAFETLRAQAGVQWPQDPARETTWRYNTATDARGDRRRGAFDFYGHADGRAWIWLRPDDPPAESVDAEYPFWLRVGPVLEHSDTGVMTQRIPTLHQGCPSAYAEFHAADARRLGIRDGDTVQLRSRRGAISISARIDFRSQPPVGQVFVPNFDESHPTGRLLLDAFCPISGQPEGTLCAVRVTRVAAAAGEPGDT